MYNTLEVTISRLLDVHKCTAYRVTDIVWASTFSPYRFVTCECTGAHEPHKAGECATTKDVLVFFLHDHDHILSTPCGLVQIRLIGC